VTRFGLLSDVHANLPALRAVLAALSDRGVDELLVAGDLTGYGGSPNECVEVLIEAEAQCVAGNHDLFVLDRLPPTRFPDLAQRSATITRELLSDDVRNVLGALPLTLRTGPVLMTHGSPDNVEEYVTDTVRGQELLAQLPERAPGADTLVLGHTHRQWCVVSGRGAMRGRGAVDVSGAARLVNPGSVGQSRQRERRPRARAAVYDSDARRVDFLIVDYNVAAGMERLDELGLPYQCLHSPPPIRRPLTRLVRQVFGRLRGRCAPSG